MSRHAPTVCVRVSVCFFVCKAVRLRGCATDRVNVRMCACAWSRACSRRLTTAAVAAAVGTVVVVTGAAHGIGYAIAEAFVAAGARVVLADVDAAGGAAAAAALGPLASAEVCDVADGSSVEALVAGVLRAHGRIDALVNNAAIVAHARPLAEVPTPLSLAALARLCQRVASAEAWTDVP